MGVKQGDFRPRKTRIQSDEDASALEPRLRRYRVMHRDESGLRLAVHPTGRKTWESNVKHPFSEKTISEFHGVFPSITVQKARQMHQAFYKRIRSGDDPDLASKQQKRRHEAHEILKTPIVQLGYELVQSKLARKELNNPYNDRWVLKQIEAVIGKASFFEFNETLCDTISKQFPDNDEGWTKRDKAKKQITKIYNSLASDVRGELRMDIPHLLTQRLGSVKQRNRSEQRLPSEELTRFWVRLVTAPVPDIHKDFLVLCLLTGERKDALLSIKLNQIQMQVDKPLVLYTETKRTNNDPDPSPNLTPITPILGLLLKRLIKQSKQVGSDFLFPGQRGNPSSHLSNVSKELLHWLGSYGEGYSAAPHNLRRTIAHEAAVATGDISVADTQVLHSQKPFKGSRVNYFSPQALEFCEGRRATYEKAHSRIDDLILSNAHLGESGGYLNESLDDYAPGELVASLCDESESPISMCPLVFRRMEGEQVLSPLASFCKGNPVMLPLDKRPLFQKLIAEDPFETSISDFKRLDFESQIT